MTGFDNTKGHESFCRICGILLENCHKDKRNCYSVICLRERKKRRLAVGRSRAWRQWVCISRPWTSCCIDNLWCDYCKGVSLEDISYDTKREISDLIDMLETIKDTGFDYLYMQYMEKEGKLRGDI
jgi:hypothetical protein